MKLLIIVKELSNNSNHYRSHPNYIRCILTTYNRLYNFFNISSCVLCTDNFCNVVIFCCFVSSELFNGFIPAPYYRHSIKFSISFLGISSVAKGSVNSPPAIWLFVLTLLRYGYILVHNSKKKIFKWRN
jgi:hypothetical protein